MNKSSIEWTDLTWNPVTGCSKVSEGCRNCYADAMFHRFKKQWGNFNDVKFHPNKLTEPSKIKNPSKIFVNSMSDLFHEKVSDSAIDQIMSTIYRNKKHTFQVLTKRPERMKSYFDLYLKDAYLPENLWLGVSVEDQKTIDSRIPILLEIPAKIRFVSCEPLIDKVTFKDHLGDWNVYDPKMFKIDWMIVGGESGKYARPMNPDWVRSIRDECKDMNVPFFFKQWGEYAPDCLCGTKYAHPSINRPSGGLSIMFRCGKKNAGSKLDGKFYKEFPIV